MSNLLPGKWKYDSNFVIQSGDKWKNCLPLYFAQSSMIRQMGDTSYWKCASSYQALQYFSSSNCHVLPLRQSFFLLYQNLHRKGVITNSTDKPYFFFLGDSLVQQVSAAGHCEFHSHENMILSQLPYHLNSSVHSSGFQAKFKWNQFLRSDLPCLRRCSNEAYRNTEGLKRDERHDMSWCQGYPDGNTSHVSPSEHPELFQYLHDIPLSVRVLVLNAGPWFILNSVRGEASSTVFKETFEGLIPHLADFHKRRNYQVDIYLLPR